MKIFSIIFSEPVECKYIHETFDKESCTWSQKEVIEKDTIHTFYSLIAAKKLIKANSDKYISSSITKIYANGDWVNCGEIKINGNNKTFVANKQQKKYGY